MFFPEGRIRVFLYGAPVDMRKSFDGLYALARHGLQQDPLSGHLFVFVNRRATQMKVLYFDRSGWCVWAKRLEAGRFIAQWAGVSQARCWVHCRRNFNEALGVEPEAASWALRQIQQLYEVERQAHEQCKEAALRRPAAAVDLARLLCLGKSADGSELENWTRSTPRCSARTRQASRARIRLGARPTRQRRCDTWPPPPMMPTSTPTSLPTPTLTPTALRELDERGCSVVRGVVNPTWLQALRE